MFIVKSVSLKALLSFVWSVTAEKTQHTTCAAMQTNVSMRLTIPVKLHCLLVPVAQLTPTTVKPALKSITKSV